MLPFIKLIFSHIPRRKKLKLQLDLHSAGKEQDEQFRIFKENKFEPLLQKLQKKRLKLLKKAKFYSCATALTAIITFFTIQKFFLLKNYLNASTHQLLFLLALIFSLIFFSKKAQSHYLRYYNLAKYNLVNCLLSFFGDFSYQNKIDNKEAHLELKQYEILPDCDFSQAEDFISGNYNNSKINLLEIKLHRLLPSEEPKNLESEIISKGIALEIEIQKKFEHKTIITKDRGSIGNLIKNININYQKITLEDPIFEKKFEIFSENQVESRYLLTPSFMQRLLDLSKDLNNAPFEACFYRQHLFIYLPIKQNLFDYNSLISKKDLQNFAQKTLNELTDIFKIVASLQDSKQ